MTTLDDVLSDKEPIIPDDKKEQTNAEPVIVETKEPEEYKSRKTALQEKEWTARGMVRDPETGQFVAKAEKPEEPEKKEVKAEEPAKIEPKIDVKAEPTQPQFSEKEKAFLMAAQEERRKRQALEERIKVMEAAKAQEPAKTFWDDPEATIKAQKEEMQSALLKQRVDTSEMIARSKYQDFDEKANIFKDLLQGNPWLYQEMLRSIDPADYAYKQAKNHMELKAAGSIEALRSQIAKEERLKLEQELKERREALEKERAALPSSLSDVKGTHVNKPVWTGPNSLDDILKG